MNGWMLFSVCVTLLFLASISRLFYIYWDIKKMTQQLKGINDHFGTNELVLTNSHHKRLSQFTTEINRLIHLYKKNERSLERREGQLKEEITNISHDLRTPLTSIKGFSDLLADKELPASTKEEYLMIIQGKIDIIMTQVDLFYELWSIESLDHKMVMEPLMLNEIIEDKMLLFYQEFHERELEVIVEPLRETSIIANEEAVHRIIINMIQNAIKYAESYVRIELLEKDEEICLRMMNDTRDLTKQDVSRVFSRGYRKNQSRGDGHLGLGLHIVEQLMQKQGGSVNAEIEKDRFVLDLLFYKRHLMTGLLKNPNL